MHCEFSLDHYEECLQAMKGKAGTVSERKQIILTHDIDIFPRYALELARLENKHGIKANYYILLHSEWYNALSPENMEIWKELQALGHELGLHYDGNYDSQLDVVHKAFCAMLGTDSIDISDHLRGITPEVEVPVTLRSRADITGYQYIADSGGWWRNNCICQQLDKKLLILTHPIWWVAPNLDVVVEDAKAVIERAKSFWQEMLNEHRKQKVLA